MTRVAGPRPLALPPAAAIGEPRLLRGLETGLRVPLDLHRRLHGELPDITLADLIELCRRVSLTGRGGAAFPVATKLAALGRGRPVVVVNATESEPASLKDRLLIHRFPHLVLDGAVIVARAIGAREIRIAVHDGLQAADLQHSRDERPGIRRLTITTDVIGGGFVAGEARSVIRALNGGPAIPPGRRTLPTEHGVGGAPTFLSNVETFAQLALLVNAGPAAYTAVGTREEPGSTLITVGGAVLRPQVLELPLGTPLDAVLLAAGARPAAGVIVGGYHGGWIQPHADLRLSRKAISAAGASLGAGVVLVLDDTTCALGELTRVASWLAHESVGQCGPCTFGLPALVADLVSLTRGGAQSEYAAQRHAAQVTGRGACAHPDGAVRFITSGLKQLSHEVATHRRRSGCGRPIVGQLPLSVARPM